VCKQGEGIVGGGGLSMCGRHTWGMQWLSVTSSTGWRPRYEACDTGCGGAWTGRACNSWGSLCGVAASTLCLQTVSNASVVSVILTTGQFRQGSVLFSLLLQVSSGGTLTEVEVDLELTGRRRQQAGFIEPSFPTIAGANGNGAIIHYRAQEGPLCK
jgi:hypothetical protein